MSSRDLYKNFILSKISDSVSSLESVGNGANIINEHKGPFLKLKTIKEGCY